MPAPSLEDLRLLLCTRETRSMGGDSTISWRGKKMGNDRDEWREEALQAKHESGGSDIARQKRLSFFTTAQRIR